jgi:AcrR family transcriptional regulator
MRQDARENRARILAAAEVVFGEQGAGGSTEEVARRAGVGIATVFRHFPTKDSLVEAALLRHLDELLSAARTLGDTDDPQAALHSLIRTMVASGTRKRTLASLLAGGAGFTAETAAAADHLKAEVRRLLRRAQDAGTVRRSVKIDELYLLIRGLSSTGPVRAGTLDRAVDIVLAGLAGQPTLPPPDHPRRATTHTTPRPTPPSPWKKVATSRSSPSNSATPPRP